MRGVFCENERHPRSLLPVDECCDIFRLKRCHLIGNIVLRDRGANEVQM